MIGTSTIHVRSRNRMKQRGQERGSEKRQWQKGGRQGAVRCIGKPGHRRCTRQQSHNTLCPARRSRYIRCTAHVQRGSMTNLSFSFCLSFCPSISISSLSPWWRLVMTVLCCYYCYCCYTCVADDANLTLPIDLINAIDFSCFHYGISIPLRYLGEMSVQHAVI